MQNILSTESVCYLKAPIKRFGLSATLVLLGVYDFVANTNPYPHVIYVVIPLIIAFIAVVVQRPRWIVYAFLLTALIMHLFAFVHIVANGKHDNFSSRDEAVEVTALALLRGENPWNNNPDAGLTTGPTSILIALPFVAFFGQINWLSFCFWLLYFLILLWCDIYLRNQTWPSLTIFFMLGVFGFVHTLYWSLEELHYPILYFAIAYLCVKRGQGFWVGAMLVASVFSRPSYIFMVMGFVFWCLFTFRLNWNHFIKVGMGFVLGGVIILLPFIVIGGKDLLVSNPWWIAYDFSGAAWPENNFIFGFLNHLNAQLDPFVMRWIKLGLTALIMLGAAWSLHHANVQHPFWHVTLGAFLAHTLIWLSAKYPQDYTLIFVLPAFLAIALTPINSPLEVDSR